LYGFAQTKVGFFLVWVKRLSPLVLIALVWAGYHYGGRWLDNRREAEEKRLALVTAQTWVATARFREQPERFLAYRDSLLSEAGVTREEISEYLERYRAARKSTCRSPTRSSTTSIRSPGSRIRSFATPKLRRLIRRAKPTRQCNFRSGHCGSGPSDTPCMKSKRLLIYLCALHRPEGKGCEMSRINVWAAVFFSEHPGPGARIWFPAEQSVAELTSQSRAGQVGAFDVNSKISRTADGLARSVGSALAAQNGLGVGYPVATTWDDAQWTEGLGRQVSHWWNGEYGATTEFSVHFGFRSQADTVTGVPEPKSGYVAYNATVPEVLACELLGWASDGYGEMPSLDMMPNGRVVMGAVSSAVGSPVDHLPVLPGGRIRMRLLPRAEHLVR